MGEARRRGSFEKRKAEAVSRYNAERKELEAARANHPTKPMSPQLAAIMAMAGIAGFSINHTKEESDG